MKLIFPSAVVSAVMVAAIASAGIACKDPIPYHLVDGGCLSEFWGYRALTHILTEGKCSTPGHNAWKCKETSWGLNIHDGYGNPDSQVVVNGQVYYKLCTETNTFWLGIKSAEDSNVACDYCTGANF